ncbi:dipeptide/oligopeptide/nickel ABC transporter ATP-binding protein [Rhodococcus ruber]|uniref:Dipeptide/oligopeptide/nickel ABC transporter ATP-binding protein n=2 Tax=Rhodococcus ruber TaxID=1830 RepID=A0ABT4MMS8_9NOCA|nr:dipeptide/oligopeptide/nickel ABC transporter ATP-binding protein [Rhodococcus ruber]MCZ4522299.1 dipeptide/oligopeptide/nickel ABC transporter ATP-binding protein [Rhodococcus ruber]
MAGVTAGYRSHTAVLHDVSLEVRAGRTMGVVGESGSGKSSLGKVIVGLLRPTAGVVQVDGVDVPGARGTKRQSLRRRVQLIPQDPYASLDPRLTVGRTLAEAIDPVSARAKTHDARISELLGLVSLDPEAASRLPHEFSGGQRQRIAIARAVAVSPALLIADEVTSALDASVQAEVLDLLEELQTALGFACVFITHNLGVAARMCDDLTVLRYGRVVEQGPASLLRSPEAGYTQSLVASVPDGDGLFLRAQPSAGVPG